MFTIFTRVRLHLAAKNLRRLDQFSVCMEDANERFPGLYSEQLLEARAAAGHARAKVRKLRDKLTKKG